MSSFFFNKIPNNTQASGSAIEIQERSLSTASSLVQRMLVMGYPDDDVTMTDELSKIKRYDSVEDVASTFGAKSHITYLFSRTYSISKGAYEIYIKPLANKDEATQKPKKMSISIDGTPTSNGYLSIYLNDELIEVAIPEGETHDKSITNIITEINAKNLPFIAEEITAQELSVMTGVPPKPGKEDVKNVLITTKYSGDIANNNKIFVNPFESERKQSPLSLTVIAIDDVEDGFGKPDYEVIGTELFDFDKQLTVISFPISNEDTFTAASNLFNKQSDPFINKQFQGIFASTLPSYSEYKTLIETAIKGKAINHPAVNIGWLKNSMTSDDVLSVVIASTITLINHNSIGRGYRNTIVDAIQLENTMQPSYNELNNLAMIGGGYLIKNNMGDVVILDLWNTLRRDKMGNPTKLEYDARSVALDIAKLSTIKEVQNDRRFANVIIVSEATQVNVGHAIKPSYIRSAVISKIMLVWAANNWCLDVDKVAKSVKAEMDINNPSRVNVLIEDESSPVLRFNAALLVKITR